MRAIGEDCGARARCHATNVLSSKGNRAVPMDVREGNLAIGVEGFEQRTRVLCGGSDKEMVRWYLKTISSIWARDL